MGSGKVRFVYAITILSIFIGLTGTAKGLQNFNALVYTPQDLMLFSYEPNTTLEIANAQGDPVYSDPPFNTQQIFINNGNPLQKGDHAAISVTAGVYLVSGSNDRFTVLSGDALLRGVCGYFALDANNAPLSQELFTFVPEDKPRGKFIIFTYDPNTNVIVEEVFPDPNGIDPPTFTNISSFTQGAGAHWISENLDSKWLRVTADKDVSALTAYDQGFYVPAANGTFSGTLFYGYVSNVGNGSSAWGGRFDRYRL